MNLEITGKKQFALCVFSDGVMIVRSSWLVEENDIECYIPPMLQYNNMLKCQESPITTWPRFPVVEIVCESGK